jgi:hypothetical protein
VQGNYLSVPLTFKDGAGDPIDLTQYTEIRMEIKKTYNVNEEAFLVFTVGHGLTISGDDNEILTFVWMNTFGTHKPLDGCMTLFLRTLKGRNLHLSRVQLPTH